MVLSKAHKIKDTVAHISIESHKLEKVTHTQTGESYICSCYDTVLTSIQFVLIC